MQNFQLNSASVPQLKVSKDSSLLNILSVYKTSLESQLLTDESKKSLYPEVVQNEADSESPKIEDSTELKKNWFKEIPSKAYSNFPSCLKDFCIETLAKNYKGGSVSSMIEGDDYENFGRLLDVELPIYSVLEINVSRNFI